ncbi:MAG: hypothetical protein PHU04_04265 [Candidatus Peribacteraceae bacterium]|nr:hypothetical protein [Candidatus Peribacteraceae bacterium]
MEANQFLFDIFTFMQTVFGLILGVVALQLIAFFLLARLLESSPKPRETGRAIFGYIMLAIGALLMCVSAITALMGVLGQTNFNTEVYLGLVLIFTVGGLLYLWHDYRLREVPQECRRIPEIIYFFAMKAIGQLSLVLSVLYLSLSITLAGNQAERWWSMPLAIFLFGFFLTWLTGESAPRKTAVAAATSAKTARGKKRGKK